MLNIRHGILAVAINHIIVLFGAGGTRGVAFLTSIVLARTLGADNFGQFSLFQAAMFICCQIPVAVDAIFIRYAKAKDEPSQLRLCLAAATRLKIFAALTLAASSFLVGYGADFFAPGGNQLTGKLLCAGMICGCFLSFMQSIANVFRVREQYGKYSAVQAVYSCAVLGAILCLAYFFKNLNVFSTILTYLAFACIFCVISLAMVVKISGNPFKADREYNKLIFKLSKWSLLIVITYYISCRADILLLSSYLEMSSVGIYSAALQLTMAVSLLISAMGTVFLPRAVKAAETIDNLVLYFKEAIIPVCLVFSGIAVLYFIAPYVFGILFTKEYAQSTSIFRILLAGYAFSAIYNPFSALFYTFDKPHVLFFLELFKLASLLVLLKIFIPRLGASGAAFSLSVSTGLYSVLGILTICLIIRRKLLFKAKA